MDSVANRTLAVATRVADAASAAAAPDERASFVLECLRELVPFVGGELACWDPVEHRYRTLRNAGYPEALLEHVNGPEMLAECEELGMGRSGLPKRMRDVPAEARALDGTIASYLLPQGYREGLTMCLQTRDGRQAGILNLSVDDERHPSDEACHALHYLNRALANVCDVTQSCSEGKIYCCIVLDAFSRRVVGWAIDTTQTTVLVTNALGMATRRRDPADGLVIHTDRGVQPGLNRSSQRRVVGSIVDARSGLPLVSSSRVFCGVGC